MNDVFITDWSSIDTIAFYKAQLLKFPFYYNSDHQLWVANSYASCKELFTNEGTGIPQPGIPADSEPDSRFGLLISKLARLSDGAQHTESRRAAMLLYNYIRSPNIHVLLEELLSPVLGEPVFDWVNLICKKLPLLCILKGLSFSKQDSDWVCLQIPVLVKIMAPNKTAPDVDEINYVIPHFFDLAHKYTGFLINSSGAADHPETGGPGATADLLACNLLGLLVQCYDAGRGLLSSKLLMPSAQKSKSDQPEPDRLVLRKMITESLRIAPPVHNTRRVALQDIHIDNRVIKAGEQILLVTAAANLDPNVFKSPEKFHPFRANNDAHLTFGYGRHACVARHLSMDLATETWYYLLKHYRNISIRQSNFEYEPRTNVKLLKQLYIHLS